MMLVRTRTVYRPDLKINFRAAWISVYASVVEANSHKRRKYWQNWRRCIVYYRSILYLDRKGDDRIVILTIRFLRRLVSYYFSDTCYT